MSGSIRLHVAAALVPQTALQIGAAQAHYLSHVMRQRVGDRLLLFNGRDGEFSAEILQLARDSATLRALAPTRAQLPPADLWLAFALLKRDATDLVVQKATELGVAAILPVITARTNAARTNPDRLAAIATEAAEQSERLELPALHPPQSLAALLAGWPAGRALAVAVERSAETSPPPPLPAGLLVGPEGGFTPTELDVLRRHAFVVPITLGRLILRADTAAIAGLSVLRAQAGF